MADERLRSLDRFLDVVFALMFFRIVQFLPSFQDRHWVALPHGLISLLAADPTNLARIVFGLIVVVYYWTRKNALLSLVVRSDGAFATLSITSLSLLCFFAYALVADPTLVGGPPTLLLQSVSLFLASLFGFLALRYAIRSGLMRPDRTPSAEHIAWVDLSNPLTAMIAIGLSWSGATVWTLSWFVFMPLFGWLLARRRTPPGGVTSI
jgi:hypothetical protein